MPQLGTQLVQLDVKFTYNRDLGHILSWHATMQLLQLRSR